MTSTTRPSRSRTSTTTTTTADNKSHLLFVYGPPAVGKYTICKTIIDMQRQQREREEQEQLFDERGEETTTGGTQNDSKLRFQLFHNHDIVDICCQFFDFGTPGFKRLRESLWLSSFKELSNQEHYSNVTNNSMNWNCIIFTFNPECTVRPQLIKQIIDMFDIVDIVELQVSNNNIIEERLNNDSRKEFKKLTDVTLYHEIQQSGGFEFDFTSCFELQSHDESYRNRLILSTDTQLPEISAQQIVQYVKTRRTTTF